MKNELRIGGADYKTRQARKKTAIIIAAALLLCVGMIVWMTVSRRTDIILKIDSDSILQEEEIPKPKVTAICQVQEKKKELLEQGYSIGEFLNDLNSGRGYKIKESIDNQTEGTYPIRIVFDKKLVKKIETTWKRKIRIRVEEGNLQVKNKYGSWEGEKFKRWDGTYVTSDFIPAKGELYYFDEEGVKVTGERIIKGDKCVFAKDGRLCSKERFVDPEKPMIALTFDDGPGKYTDTLLQKLEEYGAKATFFMLGANVNKYPETVKRMGAMGCELGNHSWSHADLLKLEDEAVKNEIQSTNEAIFAASEKKVSMVRPPFGKYDERIRSLSGLPILMWSVDTLDWKRKNTAEITEYVLNTVSDGDVVLMHDIHSFSVESAMTLIPELTKRGFQLVTVSELAKARGISLQPGEKYTQFYKK